MTMIVYVLLKICTAAQNELGHDAIKNNEKEKSSNIPQEPPSVVPSLKGGEQFK